ncbi:MAG: hypothetical protein ACYDCO_18570 [Armatimonadota bacterium]
MAKHVYAFRNIFGGIVPVVKVTAGGVIAAGYGIPVKLSGGKLIDADDNPTAIYGWKVSEAAAADTDLIDVVPGYPGIQALMAESGTYEAARMEDCVSLDKDAGGNYTVNMDGEAENLSVKVKERFTDLQSNVRVWVEAAYDTSQALND